MWGLFLTTPILAGRMTGATRPPLPTRPSIVQAR